LYVYLVTYKQLAAEQRLQYISSNKTTFVFSDKIKQQDVQSKCPLFLSEITRSKHGRG